MNNTKKNKKRRNKKRIVITSIVGILLVLLVVMFAGANYLVNFAIGRNSGTTDVAPETTLSSEALSDIQKTYQEQQEQAKAWAEECSIEGVSLLSDDGLNLCAEAIKTREESHLWVIAVHGYRGSHAYMGVPASYFGLRSFNVLLPDLRGCGKSEGDYIGMGWPDRKDMLKWIDWIIEKDDQAEIVLYGISMGGAAVMMTSGEELPDNVKAIVEDCGYTSVWDIFEDELLYLFHLPSFPMLNLASKISEVKAGYSFTEASSLEQVAKAEVPMLFIHGSEDNFVHADMIYEVYEACQSDKDMLVVEGAGHGNSYNYDPETYFDTVFDFLDAYVTMSE